MNLWRIPLDEETAAALGDPEAVTTGATASRHHLSISADGRQIAYIEAITESDIYKIAFDPLEESVRGSPVPVIQGSREVYSPDVSPDGQWIVFSTGGNTQEDIFIARADGTALRQLTDDPHKDRGPRWSSDGERIGFYSDRSGTYENWTIKPDGSDLRRLMAESGGLGLVWAPDGHRLWSFGAIHDLSIPLEERTPQDLPRINGAWGWFIAQDWSPDGRSLAGFAQRLDELTGEAGGNELFVYSLDSGEYRHVADSYAPRWLQDSRRLFLVSDEGSLFLLDTVTGDQHEVLRLDAPQAIGSVAIAPDDRTIYFTRVVEESDIWMLTLE